MLKGIQFIEYASAQPEELAQIFSSMGFSLVGHTRYQSDSDDTGKDFVPDEVNLFGQSRIYFSLNDVKNSFSDDFRQQHGSCVSAVGFFVEDAQKAFKTACDRGARPATDGTKPGFHKAPAVYGVGDSLMYFVEGVEDDFRFHDIMKDLKRTGLGRKMFRAGGELQRVDHLTNNVPRGEMQKWCDFYHEIFDLNETRYFDIQGKQTGLISKVMSSQDFKVIIPVNEPRGDKSQIQEYLDEYKGSGVQHIALTTDNICYTVRHIRTEGIGFLDVPDTYYEALPQRLPNIKEDMDRLQELKVLADGDDKGYLLQIFTKTLVGPIFYEIIQRRGHNGFGEGNFQALFDSIEEDQRRRGVFGGGNAS